MRFWFTPHSIERYIERHAKHLTYAQALAMLQDGAPNAVKLKLRSVHGHDQWKIGEAMVVTKRDPGDDKEIAVTILPARCSMPPKGVPDEEMVLALELVEERGYASIDDAGDAANLGSSPSVVRLSDGDILCAHHYAESNKAKTNRDKAAMRAITQVETAIERTRLKTLEKLIEHDESKKRMKAALTVAVRALAIMPGPEAELTLAAMRAVDEKTVEKMILKLRQDEWQKHMMNKE